MNPRPIDADPHADAPVDAFERQLPKEFRWRRVDQQRILRESCVERLGRSIR